MGPIGWALLICFALKTSMNSIHEIAYRKGLPRAFSPQTINEEAPMMRQPTENWAALETTGSYSGAWNIVPDGTHTLHLSGKALDIALSFSDRSSISPTSQFGIILRATSDLAQQTRVGYDFSIKQLFVDRTKSGNVGFDGTSLRMYYAPLMPANDGTVTMRILLDWSSVEVFGGQREVTIFAEILPSDAGTDVQLFSTGGGTSRVIVTAEAVGPARQNSTSNGTSTSSSAAPSTSSKTSTTGGTPTSSSRAVPTTLSTTPTASKTSTTSFNNSSESKTLLGDTATSAAAYDFRPTFHFCPEENWMNEPNGLIKIGSTWHLFFQYNPTGNFWGDMSWGHSTSDDLFHWKYLPVALPAENGIQCFTATSYYDAENTSGLGTATEAPYLAFYTGYFPLSGVQDQRLAYSVDQGATYTKFEGNPVLSQTQEIPHDITGGLEARDPKFFFYAPTGKWVMILAHGGQNKVTFWTSTDVKDWTWQSDFTSSDIPGLPNGITGWEVPDFFELPIQRDDGISRTTWVLMFTPADGSPAGGNGVVGITGSFDGIVFRANPVTATTLWLDYGRDWDGAMSWENVPAADGRRIVAAVMNSYGTNPPTSTWKGMLSFPRTLTLKEFDGRLTFLQQPVAELDALSTSLTLITNQILESGQTLLSTIYGKALDIRISCIPAAGSTLSLAVRVGGSERTVIRYVQSSRELQVDRTASGDISYDSAAGGVHVDTFPPDANGVVQLRVLVDECSVEVFGGEGQAVISDLIFPSKTSDGLSLATAGGNVRLQSVDVRAISL